MRKAENKNAPMLSGWVIGAAAGLVAFGALIAVGQFELFPAAAVGGVVAVIVGVVLGLPWGAEAGPMKTALKAPVPAAAKAARVADMPAKTEAAKPAPAAPPAPAATPAGRSPMAAAMDATAAPQPAALMATPKAPEMVAEKPAEKPAEKVAAKAPAEPKAKAAAKPAAAGPERLSAARGGKPDDLKVIEGIGPAMEKLVNSMGFYHFDQIAKWSEADVAVVDSEMKSFKGRITRDKWVAQAKIIVSEGLDAFRERAKTNNY
ncbi:MAG: hypothetical protein B7Z10_04875 [Rhodobacterales bacterium 32-66-7]|nr:MAG: hypothetical protein B7Z10_04875 [Rhodobacterales bacterium 32-66-7]